MERRSPILEKLAELYAASRAGETGAAVRDFTVRFDRLLREGDAESGDRYANALTDLAAADNAALKLVRHRRSGDIQRVTVALKFEPALFARIGRVSPTSERAAWAAMFQEMKEAAVPAEFLEGWRTCLDQRADSISRGERWHPFRRQNRQRARAQLDVLRRVLAWKQPALLRTVSAHVAGDSKFLERSRGAIETLLSEITIGRLHSFADLGIDDNPRQVLFHGPLKVTLDGHFTDYSHHHGASSLSQDDLGRALVECDAARCVTVENMTTFHQLCRLGCGGLFVFTSYPNRATVQLLRKLPPSMTRYHFGDTDPWGFDVLRTLRRALEPIPIRALHMAFRPNPDASPLRPRDLRTLRRLLADERVQDIHRELELMLASGTKGCFEQETLPVSGPFPYRPF